MSTKPRNLKVSGLERPRFLQFVAPLALLAAINAGFRVAPFTAVIVVVGSSVTHAGPVDSALYRVLEVAIGGVTGLAVSLLVFPARAHILAIEAAARMLDLMAGVLPELLIGFTQTLDETAILQRQDASARHSCNWPRSRPRRRASGWPILLRSLTQD